MKKSAYFTIIKDLIGKECEKTLACNSLKIRFGCDIDKRGTSYIWIDSPWEFQHNGKLITESSDYPSHDESNYEARFRKWSNLFSPLNNTLLEYAVLTDNNELELEFSGGYIIYVPYCEPDIDGEDFYDHWYAKKGP